MVFIWFVDTIEFVMHHDHGSVELVSCVSHRHIHTQNNNNKANLFFSVIMLLWLVWPRGRSRKRQITKSAPHYSTNYVLC